MDVARSEPRVDVVAVVLGWGGRIGLFKRSELVRHDKGLWHCVTGYMDDPATPDSVRLQALRELYEETGLGVGDLCEFASGGVVDLEGGGRSWRVHTVWAATTRRRLQLNWEHTGYRWVRPAARARFDGSVPWLSDVLRAVQSRPGDSEAASELVGCGAREVSRS